MTFHERTDCRLCGGAIEKVLDLGRTPLANGLLTEGHLAMLARYDPAYHQELTYPLYLSRCLTCGHVQLPVVVDPKLLFPADYPYQSATGDAMRSHLGHMANEIAPASVYHGWGWEEPGPVVEIGSNDGYLLEQFAARGYRVVGVDPAHALAMDATRRGLLTVPAFFSVEVARALRGSVGEAGLVVANNVFAHADDLREIVEGVKVLLAPEGRFVFEVGWLADVVRTNNFPAVYHEHLSYHSIVPLSNLFARRGLSLNSVERVSVQGGSIRCTVARQQSNEYLGELVTEEELAQAALPAWQSRVDASAAALGQRIHFLRNKGATIAGYGCSAKSTTLLHVADIGREQISFICDANPLKQGKFSPGKHVPIVHPDELEKRQPDYCVSLSGNFSEAFRVRHPGYRGEWIEPALT